jgi:hypothetical protein
VESAACYKTTKLKEKFGAVREEELQKSNEL